MAEVETGQELPECQSAPLNELKQFNLQFDLTSLHHNNELLISRALGMCLFLSYA